MTKLEAIRDEACTKLRDLFTEAPEDMDAAIIAVAEECEGTDKPVKFKLGFSVTYHLDKDQCTYSLGFGMRKKWESVGQAPDPNQQEMPLSLEG
jgi:hypothetical protein